MQTRTHMRTRTLTLTHVYLYIIWQITHMPCWHSISVQAGLMRGTEVPQPLDGLCIGQWCHPSEMKRVGFFGPIKALGQKEGEREIGRIRVGWSHTSLDKNKNRGCPQIRFIISLVGNLYRKNQERQQYFGWSPTSIPLKRMHLPSYIRLGWNFGSSITQPILQIVFSDHAIRIPNIQRWIIPFNFGKLLVQVFSNIYICLYAVSYS